MEEEDRVLAAKPTYIVNEKPDLWRDFWSFETDILKWTDTSQLSDLLPSDKRISVQTKQGNLQSDNFCVSRAITLS